jgi:hypothetical protein
VRWWLPAGDATERRDLSEQIDANLDITITDCIPCPADWRANLRDLARGRVSYGAAPSPLLRLGSGPNPRHHRGHQLGSALLLVWVLLIPMQQDLGWSRALLSGAFSLAVLLSGVAAIPVGRWRDRYGARVLMTTGSIAGTLLVVAWSRVLQINAFYLIWSAIGLVQATCAVRARLCGGDSMVRAPPWPRVDRDHTRCRADEHAVSATHRLASSCKGGAPLS